MMPAERRKNRIRESFYLPWKDAIERGNKISEFFKNILEFDE